MWIPLLVGFSLLAPKLAPAAAPVVDYRTWGAVTDTLRSARSGVRLTLRYPYLMPGSETVTLGGVALGRETYQINYHLGTLRIDSPLPEDATVVVTYQRQPFFIDPVQSLREVEVSDATRPGAAVQRGSPSQREESVPSGRNLVFGGSKSVSFTLGSNRGTKLDQNLQATIEGELTPTIRVRALLSDNNLPIQPEGNTEELQYLDQVFVEIEGTNAKATLGDFGFSNKISTFSPFTRQLKGISTQAWAGPGKVIAAGATSKGVFKSVKFRGTTGLQGPYELLSAGRNTGEVIIAGTERVYIDGVEVKRGQNQDYVIDYDQATITFTPRRLITRDTEISVDFEGSQEQYDRTAVFTAAETAEMPGGVTVQVLYARERDDKDQPRNTALDRSDRAVLAEAGDDAAAAVTGGVTPTDPGKGEYRLVPADSTGPEHYAFDDSTGSYLVSFVEVGVGNGDYKLGGIANTGRPYYTFVGAGAGNYTPGKALPLPESLSLVTARARREGNRFELDAEWNASDHDRNLFSPLDDGDNVGDAGRLRLALKDVPAGGARLGLAATVSTINDRFTSFDNSRPSYFYRDWNLENVPLVGREVLGEMETSASAGPASLRYSLGRLERDAFSGVKHEGGLKVGKEVDRTLEARAFDSDIERTGEVRTRRHAEGRVGYGFWRVAPSFAYATEEYLENREAAPDSGIAYDLARARLGSRGGQAFTAAVELENRNTEEIDPTTDTWRDSRRDRTATASLSSNHYAAARGEVLVTHREEKSYIFGDTRTSDLARLKGTIRVSPIGVRSDLDYEISQNQTRILARSVVFVGDGKGDYNAQGELVGKGKGDHMLVFSPTTDSQRTHLVDLNWRLVWRWSDGSSGGGGWLDWIKANVSLDQTVRVHEETTYDPAWKVYLMFPSALQRDGSTLQGVTSIRQDWSLLDGVRNTSLTVRYQRQDDEENRFEGVHEERFSGEHTVRLSRSLSQLVTANAQVSRGVRRRDGAGIPVGTGSRYDVVSHSGLGGLGLRFSAGSSADIDVEYTLQDDDESGARQALLSLRPRFVWRVGEHVNVYGSYELTQTWDRIETPVKPIFFGSEGDSHRWTLTPNFRVTRMITIVAAYQGRSETAFSGARITEHELRLETRAFF